MMLRLWQRAGQMWFMWLRPVVVWLWLWLRPAVKGVLRRTTRLCELQRICYATVPGAGRSLAVELCLDRSRHPEIKDIVRHMDGLAKINGITADEVARCVYAVMKTKYIKSTVHNRFARQLDSSLTSIYGYKQLLTILHKHRTTRVTWDTHADTLRLLWTHLRPHTPLQSDISPQWSDVGFQGKDPCTDFRGMGELGLLNLSYFAREHPSAARHVLLRSSHPQWGYSFAIVCINLTALVLSLCEDGALRTHLYNVAVTELLQGQGKGRATATPLHQFHQVFSYAILEFDALWRKEKPRDIMEFGRVRKAFEGNLRLLLSDERRVLKTNFVLDDV